MPGTHGGGAGFTTIARGIRPRGILSFRASVAGTPPRPYRAAVSARSGRAGAAFPLSPGGRARAGDVGAGGGHLPATPSVSRKWGSRVRRRGKPGPDRGDGGGGPASGKAEEDDEERQEATPGARCAAPAPSARPARGSE